MNLSEGIRNVQHPGISGLLARELQGAGVSLFRGAGVPLACEKQRRAKLFLSRPFTTPEN